MPLTAGVAALILHANPHATPLQVRDMLRSTASQANTPDNEMGWGIIDAYRACGLGGDGGLPTGFFIDNSFPNPFPTPSNPSTIIPFALPVDSHVTITIFDILGREVRSLVNQDLRPNGYGAIWNGRNNAGNNVASGVYLYRLVATGVNGQSFTAIKKLTLLR